jgi:NAD(P)-dependent dehydrogenase (short-subunit alcohol dehydrogenase family)
MLSVFMTREEASLAPSTLCGDLPHRGVIAGGARTGTYVAAGGCMKETSSERHAKKNGSDPRKKGPKPPFPPQEQKYPGTTAALEPRPDHGEETYEGSGKLEGRVALITGGDSGIGRAVAIAYAREGADVAISYVADEERGDAEDTVKWIEKAGRRALAVQVDLSEAAGCARLVREVAGAFERIDVLVNNAAYQGKAVERFEELTAERIRKTFATNIEAVFHVTREALPHMKKGAAIISTTSIQARDPNPTILDYAATKAAIVDFTIGLAKELIERGIRVNAVAPGPVWTPLIAQSFSAEEVAEFGKDNPMERPAQPAELAPTYVFLASDDSRFVVGEVIAVTGGRAFS